jgi:hypothetical protein
MIGWFFLCIALTYLNIMSVANIAHGAGFGFGVVYGLAIFDTRHRTRWSIVAVLASLIVLSTLITCPGHWGYERAKRRMQAFRSARNQTALADADTWKHEARHPNMFAGSRLRKRLVDTQSPFACSRGHYATKIACDLHRGPTACRSDRSCRPFRG